MSGEGHIYRHEEPHGPGPVHFHLDPETRGVGVNVPGAFAEYLRIPAFNDFHLPPEVDGRGLARFSIRWQRGAYTRSPSTWCGERTC